MREMGNRKDDMPVHDLKSCTRNDNPGSTRQRNNNNNFNNNNKEHSVNEEYNNSNEPVQCFKCKGYGHLAYILVVTEQCKGDETEEEVVHVETVAAEVVAEGAGGDTT